MTISFPEGFSYYPLEFYKALPVILTSLPKGAWGNVLSSVTLSVCKHHYSKRYNRVQSKFLERSEVVKGRAD